MENKPANFLVVPFGRHLAGFPHLAVVASGRQLLSELITAISHDRKINTQLNKNK